MPNNAAGLILAGGQSSRMGCDKALLACGPERMVQRIVRIASESLSPIVVVGSAQAPTDLPSMSVEVLLDRQPGRGPLEGLTIGLQHLEPSSEWTFVTGCDSPLITTSWIEFLLSHCTAEIEIVVPSVANRYHPLCAVFRTRLWPRLDRLIQLGERKLQQLPDIFPARILTETQLRAFDPELSFLSNINTPGDYEKFLTRLNPG